jgi:hypothetical protein
MCVKTNAATVAHLFPLPAPAPPNRPTPSYLPISSEEGRRTHVLSPSATIAIVSLFIPASACGQCGNAAINRPRAEEGGRQAKPPCIRG